METNAQLTEPAPPLSPEDERTWAMLAHLSVLVNLVTGFLGPVAALVIYLVYKDRSRYVAYQSMQAFVFQLIWWVGAGALIEVMRWWAAIDKPVEINDPAHPLFHSVHTWSSAAAPRCAGIWGHRRSRVQ